MDGLKEIVKKEYVEGDKELCFQTMPLLKLILLWFFTFGIYNYIYFYNFWKKLNTNFGYKTSPFWRCFFSNFTNFKLFPILEKYFKSFNMKPFYGGLFATLYFILIGLSNKLNIKTMMAEETMWGYEITIIILELITLAIILPIQTKINEINKLHFPNAPVNGWKVSNYIWLVICGILNLLAFLGMLVEV